MVVPVPMASQTNDRGNSLGLGEHHVNCRCIKAGKISHDHRDMQTRSGPPDPLGCRRVDAGHCGLRNRASAGIAGDRAHDRVVAHDERL